MKKLSALIGIFILSFGVSILMCTILPYAAIVFIQAALLIAAGDYYKLSVRRIYYRRYAPMKIIVLKPPKFVACIVRLFTGISAK